MVFFLVSTYWFVVCNARENYERECARDVKTVYYFAKARRAVLWPKHGSKTFQPQQQQQQQQQNSNNYVSKITQVGRLTGNFVRVMDELREIKREINRHSDKWCENDNCRYADVSDVNVNAKIMKACQQSIRRLRSCFLTLQMFKEYVEDELSCGVWYDYLKDEFRCHVPAAIKRCGQLIDR